MALGSIMGRCTSWVGGGQNEGADSKLDASFFFAATSLSLQAGHGAKQANKSQRQNDSKEALHIVA